MKKYLLFLYGDFTDHQDVEFYCMDVLGKNPSINSIRYVIESLKNIIVIFESSAEKEKLIFELKDLLSTDPINFYFLFEKTSLITANLPVEVREFIFKPNNENLSVRIEYKEPELENKTEILDLDVILSKIKFEGIESLTENEKTFLENFKN